MQIPTIIDIKNNLNKGFIESVKAKVPDFNPDSQKINIFNGWSVSLSTVIRTLYLYTNSISREATPFTANLTNKSDAGQLAEWGAILLGEERRKANKGEYEINIVGTGYLPAGTRFVNKNNQKEYFLSQGMPANGNTPAKIISAENGNVVRLFNGEKLTIKDQIDGISEEVEITRELIQPRDEETAEEYRQRILKQSVVTPRGGSIGDITKYCLGVKGVQSAFCYNGEILADAKVYIKADKQTSPDNIPPTKLLDEVKAALKLKANFLAPLIEVLPVKRREYIVEVLGLSNELKKPSVEKTINDYFNNAEPTVDGVTADYKQNDNIIMPALLFSDIMKKIKPDTIADLVVIAKDRQEYGYFLTKDISKLTDLWGKTSPAVGELGFNRDNQDTFKVTIKAQEITNLNDYILLLNQELSSHKITVEVFRGIKNQTRLKFISQTKHTDVVTSKVEVVPILATSNIDLSSASYIDIANADSVVKPAGEVFTLTVNKETLADGTIGYVSDINYSMILGANSYE